MAKILMYILRSRDHSNQISGAKRREVSMKCLHCLCCRFTTVGKITKPLPELRPWMYSLHFVKISWTLVR